MKKLMMPVVAALGVFCVGLGLAAGGAAAQTAKDLVGAWTVVSITVEGDGKKSEPFGPKAIGMQIYDSSGRSAFMVMRSDLPKVASNNRATSTPEESQKIVHGSLAYYGTYTVNAAEKSVTMQVEGATFPNWIGTSPKRLYAISGDTLTITNPTPSGGGGVLTVVLKRAGQKAM